jgi:hypothetical protein
MKNFILLSIFSFFCLIKIAAQAPMVFNYQAVVRDAAGVIVANKNVNFRIGITSGANGVIEYSETHNATTNPNGLVTLLIGSGTPVSGTMSAVTWAGGNKFIQTEMDITGGTNYKLMGSTQLLSVPYALVALSTPPSFHMAWSTFQNFSINQGGSSGLYVGGKWLGGDVEDIFLTASSVSGITFNGTNQTITRKENLESIGFSKTFDCVVAPSVAEGNYPIYLKSSTKSGRIYYDTAQIKVICSNPIPTDKAQKIVGTTTCTSGYVRKDTASIIAQKIPNSTSFNATIYFNTDYPSSYYSIITPSSTLFFGKMTGNAKIQEYSCLKKGDKFENFQLNLYPQSGTFPLSVKSYIGNEFIYDIVSKLKIKFILTRETDTDTCTFEGSY